jgi:hypothetical protein
MEGLKLADTVLAITLLGTTAFLLGLVIEIAALGFKQPILSPMPTERTKVWTNFSNLLIFLGIFLYCCLFVLRGIPYLAENVAVARVKYITGMGPILWAANSFIINGLFLQQLVTGQISKLSFVLGCFLIFLTGWRGPIIQLLFGIFFLRSMLRGGIKYHEAALLMSVGVLLIAILGIIRAVVANVELYEGAIAFDSSIKIFQAPFLYIYLRIQEHFFNFVKTISYFEYSKLLCGGGLLMDLSIILPGGEQGLDFYLRRELIENDWIGGGGMPPTLFGSLFADFGSCGVFFVTFLIYIFLAVFYRFAKFHPITCILYVNCAIFTIKAFFGSLGQNFLLYNLVFNGFFIFAICLFTVVRLSLRTRCSLQ